MNPPIAIESLPLPAQKLLDPNTPGPLRQMAAKGIAPGLRPGDTLAVLALLSESDDAALRAVAVQTLDKLPTPLLNGALAAPLHPAVIHLLAPRYAKNAEIAGKLLLMGNIAPETVELLATQGNEAICELIATNEERLLSNPTIIAALYMNRSTRMSTADRVVELAVRNKVRVEGIPVFDELAEALSTELVPEATPEPTPDDVMFVKTTELGQALEKELNGDGFEQSKDPLEAAEGKEKAHEKVLPLHALIASMGITQKIRLAMLGTKAERGLLVRDTNKLVAVAAIRSPMTQESEVVAVSKMRNVSEAVLANIARDKKYSQNHEIKFNLVGNPRTPFIMVSKFIGHLREDELKTLAKSKNVPGIVANACRQALNRKKK